MKKKLLIVLLLLVCFWHINVKAENETPEIITSDPEVAEIEKEKEEERTKVNTKYLSERLGVNRKTIQRDLAELVEKHLVRWVGSDKDGHWEV